MNLFKLSGIASVFFGVLCCLSLINPTYLRFGFLFTILGFISSTANIYLNAKYEITKSSLSLGYIGMILSSVPVIFILVLIIKNS